MALTTHDDIVQARLVAGKVWRDAIKNIIFYGIAVSVALFFTNTIGWQWVGWVALVGFGVLCLFSIITTLFALGGAVFGTFYILSGKNKDLNTKQQTWFWVGCFGRIIEESVSIFLLIWLYNGIS